MAEGGLGSLWMHWTCVASTRLAPKLLQSPNRAARRLAKEGPPLLLRAASCLPGLGLAAPATSQTPVPHTGRGGGGGSLEDVEGVEEWCGDRKKARVRRLCVPASSAPPFPPRPVPPTPPTPPTPAPA